MIHSGEKFLGARREDLMVPSKSGCTHRGASFSRHLGVTNSEQRNIPPLMILPRYFERRPNPLADRKVNLRHPCGLAKVSISVSRNLPRMTH